MVMPFIDVIPELIPSSAETEFFVSPISEEVTAGFSVDASDSLLISKGVGCVGTV